MATVNPQIITIEAPSLQNNKLGDSIQREVLVYLPPSYRNASELHYPVIYLMHGFGGNARGWFNDEIPLQQISDQLIAAGKTEEMIIVVPENTTNLTCSAYLNSSIQGNWQNFICQDLITAMEEKYRIKTGSKNRAIVGHSSGGDAVLKTLLLSPGVFKHGFAMSAPNLDASGFEFVKETYDQHFDALLQVNAGKVGIDSLDIWAHIVLCYLQTAFPETDNAPLFCKFPLQAEHWAEVSKVNHTALYEQHKHNLAGVNLALDVGLKEHFIDKTRSLVKQMNSDGYAVKLIEFDGGHVDHMAKSLPYVLTYLSDCFSKEN